MNAMEMIDVRRLEPELDALVALAAPGADGKQVIRAARKVLTQALTAPATEEPSGRWQAYRLGAEQVACWTNDSFLLAIWDNGALASVHVTVGAESWGVRGTEHGDARISTDGLLEGSGDRRRFADFETRARQQLEDWTASETATTVSGGVTLTDTSWDWPARPALPSFPMAGDELELPEVTAQALARMLQAMPVLRFDVVLLQVPPERRASIAQIVAPAPMQDALPFVARAGLSPGEAESLRKRLQREGATVELRESSQ
ncbi:MAG: hypothetical protein JOZ54_09690 [Acidobacteria bacterium]|nr:hypothetical protein [Acidobacteriota bacterium]